MQKILVSHNFKTIVFCKFKLGFTNKGSKKHYTPSKEVLSLFQLPINYFADEQSPFCHNDFFPFPFMIIHLVFSVEISRNEYPLSGAVFLLEHTVSCTTLKSWWSLPCLFCHNYREHHPHTQSLAHDFLLLPLWLLLLYNRLTEFFYYLHTFLWDSESLHS